MRLTGSPVKVISTQGIPLNIFLASRKGPHHGSLRLLFILTAPRRNLNRVRGNPGLSAQCSMNEITLGSFSSRLRITRAVAGMSNHGSNSTECTVTLEFLDMLATQSRLPGYPESISLFPPSQTNVVSMVRGLPFLRMSVVRM